MTDKQQQAIDNLRSGNVNLAHLIKDATEQAVRKAAELIKCADNAKDLKDSIAVIESSAKIVGLSPKESQTNIQINAINGFEFIEIDAEEVKQIRYDEEFEDAEVEEAN